MKKLLLFLFVALICGGCNDNKRWHNPMAEKFADSIEAWTTPSDNPHILKFLSIDEVYHGEKDKVWEWRDSLDKYCNNEELKDMALNHKSVGVRYVTFKLLLQRDPHEAIKIAIEDINCKDSIDVSRLDIINTEALTSLRVDLIQFRKEFNISAEDSIAVDNAVLNSEMKEQIVHYEYYLKKLLEE